MDTVSFCLQKSQESDTRANWLWPRGELLSSLKGSEVDERQQADRKVMMIVIVFTLSGFI